MLRIICPLQFTVCERCYQSRIQIYIKCFLLLFQVEQRYLREMILVQETEEESLKLKEAVERKETDEVVKEIENKATEISGDAHAKSTYILTEAQANATKLIGLTNSEGMKKLMANFGFTPEQKMSYFYLKSLAESSHTNLAVDFNNYVIGGR